jgi:hypothetical protein
MEMSSNPEMGPPAPSKSATPPGGKAGEGELFEATRIAWEEYGVRVWVKGDEVLLVRKYYPCPHYADMEMRKKAKHIHFWLTDVKSVDTPEKMRSLIEWLEYGFWCDSGIWSSEEGLETLKERFYGYKCPGALQNL